MAHMEPPLQRCATGHAGGVTVTVSVDAVHFMSPGTARDVLVMHCAVNRAWRSSMEVGVRVEAEALGGGVPAISLSAYLSFVAVDPEASRARCLRLLTRDAGGKAAATPKPTCAAPTACRTQSS